MKQLRYLRFNLFICSLAVMILCCVPFLFAQEKQKIPAEFFTGKWAGEIKGEVRGCLPCWHHSKHQCSKTLPWHAFRIEVIGNRADASMKIQAKYPPVTFQAGAGVGFMHPNIIGVLVDVGDPITIPQEALGFVAVLYTGGFKIYEASNEHLNLIFGAFDKPVDMRATADFYKTMLLKKTFPKDIKPNEPIKTDKKTLLEITMPDVGKVNIAPNTEAVFKSQRIIDLIVGEINARIEKMPPEIRVDYDENVWKLIIGDIVKRVEKLPEEVKEDIIPKGAELILNVKKDGTATLTVIDGVIEFSDTSGSKTVLVKKNQKSVVKPGALPTVPEGIDPGKILKWWE